MTIKFPVDESKPWFSGKYWPKGVPKQLDIDFNMSLSGLLDRAVSNWGDYPVMWFLDSWVLYKDFKVMVDKLATYLDSIGVKKGDVVAVHLPNCIQYVVSYYAITKIGAIITGINPTYKPLEILHQCKLTGAKYYIGLDALWFHYVRPFQDKWDFDKIIYTNLVDQATGLSSIKKALGKMLKKIPKAKVDHPNAVKFMDAMKSPANPPSVKIDAEKDVATLIMTGGTTGVPKAAVLTHMNCVANAKQCEILLVNQKENESDPDMGPNSAMVGVLPLYHSFAMTTVMNVCIASGSWMMLYPKPPETEVLLKDISSIKIPTKEGKIDPNGIFYCGAEILFKRVADLPQEILDKYSLKGRLKLCMSGAGPLHDYVREPFEAKTGAAITEGYGLSEASPVLTVNNFFGEREPGYIGVPVPGTDVQIFDSEDFSKGPITTLGEEGTGEICAAGPQIMKEYWEQPDRTAATLMKHGGKTWLLTGDIGFMDEHGRFAIRDRKKQLIKMAGHSVFPSEVETLLGQHPDVKDVAVAGLPDKKLGEIVKAWVVLKEGATITSDEIKAWAKENMTKWKAPGLVEIIDEVPTNAIGKVMRRVLQEADPIWKEVHDESSE
ncbi:MAG: AMP-binding protein [Promethearchaeota archaeon]